MKKLLIVTLMVLLLTSCEKADPAVSVFIEIDCSDIHQHYDNLDESLRDEKFVPEDGIILKETKIYAEEGDSAVDVLKKAATEFDLQIDVSNGYAKGINYIYEKSCGTMSGWIYEVNHEPIMTEYVVSEGDIISWIYICDFSEMSFS